MAKAKQKRSHQSSKSAESDKDGDLLTDKQSQNSTKPANTPSNQRSVTDGQRLALLAGIFLVGIGLLAIVYLNMPELKP